jgi:heme/copper-type cytochrome/quinol oxidase subunit 3
MYALPPAPAPSPRRQIFVGTALACAAGAALMGGMLGLWMNFRQDAIDTPEKWVPKGVTVPMIPANIMLISCVPLCMFAQWAVYSARRDDRPHTGLAILLTGLVGIAFINAQAYTWGQMEIPASSGTYATLFYAVTGVMTAMVVIGVVFSGVVAFRYLGGRTTERELVSAHALYWYCLSAVYAAMWFVVYVTK